MCKKYKNIFFSWISPVKFLFKFEGLILTFQVKFPPFFVGVFFFKFVMPYKTRQTLNSFFWLK